ncbi:Phosphoribosylformylglycinamidine synthase [Hondaea fermentalgiana]|uniref:phosphoribosylformylglycinamidine synthase n=1 Tax=Hondaea fermentalgiana TaxID=2315210 RepID=A0A2R5GKL4_9STRA|nr:Phosphoribosylformylglycinamidine synthase [Hondaea fermentalgiana]|eukprot:GBG29163.1 Phosphoribosylformylglycinamidine synthase [Hondaea fermentalgiana]
MAANDASRVVHMFRTPAIGGPQHDAFLRSLAQETGTPEIEELLTEFRYNIETDDRDLTEQELTRLSWLLSETFEQEQFGTSTFLPGKGTLTVEVGPRLSFSTAWSSNAVTICQACGLECIRRIERSRRYEFTTKSKSISDEERKAIENAIHDRMTEFIIEEPITSFAPDQEALAAAVGTRWIPVMEQGRAALQSISEELGLAFDDWDLDFYTKLFKDKLARDPSDVECFDLAQSNSEHSRHWFFSGKMVIDGTEMPSTLFQMVKGTNPACSKTDPQPNNSVIAFHDNSSAIRGFPVRAIMPSIESKEDGKEAEPSSYAVKNVEMHGILTAETHNFPCGVAPFPGAETGTGGRIRDVHATGRGALVVAGTSSYCVGNLRIPGYEQPWEDADFEYPSNMARPLQIEIEASNGASDYGNKFGEPVISGYTRSFGMRLPNGERREWIKPIMMSSGVGLLDGRHVTKGEPEKGMVVVKVGGPAYRIGMGGGAASSRVQDAKTADLDFNAVQRGDAEMENKMNRVIRACVELGDKNPIVSIHDQGAGGNGNVLKEISEPAGAELFLRRLPQGDKTMTALELWGAEYQENCALLIRAEHKPLFERICARENMPFAFLGEITGDSIVRVHDERDGSTPVNLHLDDVLGKMPQKTFTSERAENKLEALNLDGVEFSEALDRVLRLLQIGSKRFLTTKVDRSVTGLIAQQQCVGPLHTPLADVGIIAQAHFPDANGKFTGVATAIGEQPIKGLVSAGAMARMTVAESLTNLVFAKVTALEDVKCSANWMWAAKLAGEGAAMYDACEAMCKVMHEVGIAVDGGKDSLSMAAKAGDEVVKCPGQLAISVYAMCPDVTLTATPDLKRVDEPSRLVHIAISEGGRLGGSALAQVYKQIGDSAPDLDDPSKLVAAFNATQEALEARQILAGHDVSDGGLITCILEMAFAGNLGLDITVPSKHGVLADLFAEEAGLVLQVAESHLEAVKGRFEAAGVTCTDLGAVVADAKTLAIKYEDADLFAAQSSMTHWRDVWEATSFRLDKLQANPACVESEMTGLKDRTLPPWKVSFDVEPEAAHQAKILSELASSATSKPRVAVLREEGSNGDREMAAAFTAAGFEAWDVAVADLKLGKVKLADFQGIAFVGGFSYADVMDSAKGWAGVIRFNEAVWNEFQTFYQRPDTFSLGVCNGCQLMALLGWVPGLDETYNQSTHDVNWEKQPRFVHNASGRYESRFVSVKVREDNGAMMFKGMEGSVLGVWVAHGEGRAHFPDEAVMKSVLEQGQAPLRYVDDAGEETEAYPFNPNGSPKGVTALASANGRHLALMPHPERACRMWQWPWKPTGESWTQAELSTSPWAKMFNNAYRFATSS